MPDLRLVPHMGDPAFRCAHGGHNYFKDIANAEFRALLDPEQYGLKTAKNDQDKRNVLWGIMGSVTNHIEGEEGRHKRSRKDNSLLEFYDSLSATFEAFSELKEWNDIALYVHCGRNKRLKECKVLCLRCRRSTENLYPVHETAHMRQFAALVLKDALGPFIQRIRSGGDSSSSHLTAEEYRVRMEIPSSKRARTSTA